MSFVINPVVPLATTPEIVFLKGSISLSAYSIPFFTANVPLSFAADYFKLFEELPQANTGEWTLEELFQRDISWERVDNEILQYLKSTTRPQFFNALTIALLPGRAESLGGDFGPGVSIPRIDDGGLGAPIMVGGIQIQFYGSDVDMQQGAGKLRWALEHVDAVAVDGQHRLAAIKKYVKEANPDLWRNASVPIIFLLADERVGFSTPRGEKEKPRSVSALRSVFIDLNKNAKPVSPTRTILLDDLDIVSVCTRSLIGRSLGDSTEPDRIPLPLVDWMTDRNKIDDGPFLTTVVLLQEAVTRILGVPDLLMDEDDNSIEKVEKWLTTTLPIPDGEARDEVLQQVRACARQQTRLSWLPAQIRTLQTAFEAEWRPHVHRLFREFAPYARVWDLMAEGEHLGPLFINLFVAQEIMPSIAGRDRTERLVQAAKQAADGAWSLEKDYAVPMATIGGLKSDEWAYKVVFQRALLRLLANVLNDPVTYFGAKLSKADAVERLLAALNQLDAAKYGTTSAKLGKERFWAGSGLTADDVVEFTNAGAERLRAWLEAFVILKNLDDPPRFKALDAGTAKTPQRRHLARLFAQGGVIWRGMAKLSVSRGFELDDDETPAAWMKARYDAWLRLLSA